MTPGRMSESLADAHRRDLLREAQQAALAALAAKATAEAPGLWTAALLVVADLLMAAGQRLRARLGRGQVAHAHHAPYAPYRVDGLCQGRAECEGVVWLDV